MKKSFQWRSFHRLSVRNTATLPREGKEQIHRGTPHCFQGSCRPPPDSHEGLPPPPGASAPAERARKERRLFLVFWVFWGGREGKNFCFVLFVLFCFVSSWRSRGIGTALASGSFLSRHQLAGVHGPHSPARESVAQVAGCQSRIQGGIKKSV